ncbi:hypothetical protein [Streptomyces sp. NPDC020607]|uniref:hypothetical protein n=1 Tax=Streptomyces sp. NPDC020607 TaxID=3365082 RepID=UPI0037B1C10E
MMIVLLTIVMMFVAAGLGAVIWAARGGPRWVHGVAKATIVTADVVAAASKRNRRRGNYSSGSGDLGASSDSGG